jgi:hypothetical protein
MRKYIAAVALVVAIIAPLVALAVCVCPRPVVSYLYKTSTRVFLGEVVKIELLTLGPVGGQEVTYAATVRPLEIFKGVSNTNVRVTFITRYRDPAPIISLPGPPVIDPAFSERAVTIVTSDRCDSSNEMADSKYYIFEKQGEPLVYSGCGTERIVSEVATTIDAMRSLRDAR